jgi:hypothetical protein
MQVVTLVNLTLNNHPRVLLKVVPRATLLPILYSKCNHPLLLLPLNPPMPLSNKLLLPNMLLNSNLLNLLLLLALSINPLHLSQLLNSSRSRSLNKLNR